jgi:hypothetical protein
MGRIRCVARNEWVGRRLRRRLASSIKAIYSVLVIDFSDHTDRDFELETPASRAEIWNASNLLPARPAMQRTARSTRHLRHAATARVLTALPQLSSMRLAFGGAIAAAGLAHAVTALMHTIG